MSKKNIKFLMCLCFCLIVVGLTPKATAQAACSHNWGSYSTTKSATCTSAGSKKRTCSKCGKSETASIPALGHNAIDDRVQKSATCTSTGVMSLKCSRCGTGCGSRTIAKTSHSYNAATCSSPKTCKYCGTTSGNSLGHNYQYSYSSATCTGCGYKTTTCSRCSYNSKTVSAQPLGHNFEKYSCTKDKCSRCSTTQNGGYGHNPVDDKVQKGATCTETGVMSLKCSRCGTGCGSRTIAKISHNYNAATCTTPKTCKVCGTTSGNALGHDYKYSYSDAKMMNIYEQNLYDSIKKWLELREVLFISSLLQKAVICSPKFTGMNGTETLKSSVSVPFSNIKQYLSFHSI